MNAAESQVTRQQDSSIVSNVVNSNSAGSNSSQKTRTNVSQQLALVGVCSNCGSHQLTSMPNVNSRTTIAGGNKQSQPSTKVSQCSKKNNLNEQAHGSGGSLTKCRIASNLPVSKSAMLVSSHGATTSGGGGSSGGCIKLYQKGSARIVHSSKVSATSAAGPSARKTALDDCMLVRNGSAQNYGHHHQRQKAAQQQQHTTQNQELADQQQPASSSRRQIASLSKLHELSSMTCSERHDLDESLSSLANDSLMMIVGQENSDAAAHNNNNNCHLSSSNKTEHIQFRGSDPMLCNQSIQSLDYCSDCCPSSSCHCSCPLCSSNGGDDRNGSGICLHPFSGPDLMRSNDDNGSGDYDAMCILQLIHNDDCALRKPNTAAHVTNPSSSSTPPAHSMCIMKRKKSDEAPQPSSGEASTSLAQRTTTTGYKFNSSSQTGLHHRTGGDGSDLRGHRPSQTIEMRTIAESDHHHAAKEASENMAPDACVADYVSNQAAATAKNASGYAIQAQGIRQQQQTSSAPIAFALKAAAKSALGAAASSHVSSQFIQYSSVDNERTNSDRALSADDAESSSATRTDTADCEEFANDKDDCVDIDDYDGDEDGDDDDDDDDEDEDDFQQDGRISLERHASKRRKSKSSPTNA